MKPAGGADRAVKVQRKIFTRWVNQKLARRNIQVEDIVTAVHDGVVLITLMEGTCIFRCVMAIYIISVLSEKKYAGKALKSTAMRVQKIDNITIQLPCFLYFDHFYMLTTHSISLGVAEFRQK